MLVRKFARKKANRSHMLRNLAASLILYEKVETTEAKAKEIKKLVDRSITLAKKNTLAARRQLDSIYFDSNVVKKLFEVLNARFTDRTSGFTQSVRLGNRLGDGAETMLVTLIADTKPVKDSKEAKEKADDKTADKANTETANETKTEAKTAKTKKESQDA
jgi:large subunit ribosomal protein L17